MSSDTPGLRASALRDSNFEIAADLDPLEPSYISEDSRLTLLRGKCYHFTRNTWASFHNIASCDLISHGSHGSKPLREAGKLKNSKWKGELESVEVKIDELRRDIREVEAQNNSLKADLERLGVRAVLDSSNLATIKPRSVLAINAYRNREVNVDLARVSKSKKRKACRQDGSQDRPIIINGSNSPKREPAKRRQLGH
ncbi:hypothetical protein BKA61DRAFT_583034 [Leptodontidium sp. MPI-SDFR-AT-0119]|nr:hypothetical protein BKA61DRAFT_583034 [Leptodontidium sp. MPI-SDFR-AT-0119]